MSSVFFRPFLYGCSATLPALSVAAFYFPQVRTMASCALIAFGLAPYLQTLLESNRVRIWEENVSPWIANRTLAFEFLALFFGIFFVAGIGQLFLDPAAVSRIGEAYRNTVPALLHHNTAVLSAGFVLSLAYRAAGLTLVLSWNALHWAETLIGYFLRLGEAGAGAGSVGVAAALLPHLALEVLSYALAGMSGVFLSKALCKYGWLTPQFRRVAWACVTLLVLSLGSLTLAACAEVYLAQPVFSAFRGA